MAAARLVNGVIENAMDLTVNDVVQQRVRCPGCSTVFEMWPGGWDAHASYRCDAVAMLPSEAMRKKAYKGMFGHLFR